MKKSILLISLIVPFLCACNSNNSSDNSGDGNQNKEPEPTKVNVFVLAGQSNMEGNTLTTNLQAFCNDTEGHDYNEISSGYEDIQISYYNHYSNSTYNYSNKANPDEGGFVSTRPGQGVRNNNYFGPEVGIAETLSHYKTEQNNNEVTYLIKFTSGGTGFLNTSRDGNSNYTWRSTSTGKEGYLYTKMLEFVQTNLDNLTDVYEVQPVLKGFLWMQGESDGTNLANANAYEMYLTNLISDFRYEFGDYAPKEDGDNIAFIDAEISSISVWNCCSTINQAKQNISELADNNYLIKTNADGLDLKISNAEHGGGDQYHYTVDSMIKLGNAFGQQIIEGELL